MDSWNAGYVTDVAYTYGMYRELTPAILNFVGLVAGIVAPNPSSDLTYCELGCGQGFATNLLAAANPRMEFHATDFNPSHIVGARSLADAAGTRNVHFHDSSFAEFGATPGLPNFDIIALHGIYSWINAENRQHIVNFIKTRLNVGGLVYVSYNALPGWSAIMPLRRLMADHAEGLMGPTAVRVEQALAYAQRLADVSPHYFRVNPVVGERFERIKTLTRNYIAHEYFNRDLTPFYHADVAAELEEAKLSYVGSANLLDTLDAANLTAEQDALLKSVSGSRERETLRDFVLNQQFRRDVYVKGPVPLNAVEVRQRWLKTRFVLSTRRMLVPNKVTGALGEATLKDEIYQPILNGLADGPRTVEELMSDPKIESVGWGRVLQALTVLVGSGHLQPALDRAGDGERLERAKAFNMAVIEKARASDLYQYLAAAVSGGAVAVDRISQLFLFAAQHNSDNPPALVWEQLKAVGQSLMREGNTLETPEENLAEVEMLFERFKANQLPVFRSIGVV